MLLTHKYANYIKVAFVLLLLVARGDLVRVPLFNAEVLYITVTPFSVLRQINSIFIKARIIQYRKGINFVWSLSFTSER